MEHKKSSFVKQKWLINTITILVIILAFAFVFRELQRNKVDVIGIILPPTSDVIIGFLFIFLVVIINPFIWYFLMNGCGAQISKKEASGIWWSTNIARYVPGRVSIIASRVWVARKWGPKVVLESLGWELILTTSSALLASSLLIFSSEISFSYKVLVSILALLSLFPFINPEFSQKLLRKPLQLLGKDEWKQKTVMTRMHYFNALFLMTVTWILWGFGHQFILKSMGFDAAIWELIGIFSFAYLVGYFAFFIPAGFGAREGTFTYLLSIMISGGLGAGLAIISRVFNIMADVVMFFVGGLLMPSIILDEDE
ncbi:MAG TPA: hypothetical protein D7H86_04095 [Candidatus Poseidoniales archaeon]|nr:MAG TPA: hypothetical protein D7H86_04095 [Candidatus Poseidoniales archaeon]